MNEVRINYHSLANNPINNNSANSANKSIQQQFHAPKHPCCCWRLICLCRIVFAELTTPGLHTIIRLFHSASFSNSFHSVPVWRENWIKKKRLLNWISGIGMNYDNSIAAASAIAAIKLILPHSISWFKLNVFSLKSMKLMKLRQISLIERQIGWFIIRLRMSWK